MNCNNSLYLLWYQHPKAKKRKILKKSKESPRSILSTEILLSVPIIPLQAVSHQWATVMTFSFSWVGDNLAIISVEKCNIGNV
jgi:hypothetical protein